MVATFPGGIPEAPTRGTNLSDSDAHTVWHDRAWEEIRAITQTLGIDPQGGESTVVARLDAIDDASSTTWTPNFTSAAGGTGGEFTGRYWRLGPLGVVWLYLKFGSGGLFGGAPTVDNLPLTFLGATIGVAYYSDATTRNYVGAPYVSGSTITKFAQTESTDNGVVSTTSPFTWTEDDELIAVIVGFVA